MEDKPKPGDKQIVDDVAVMPPVATGPAQSLEPSINATNDNQNMVLPPIMAPEMPAPMPPARREPSGDNSEFDFND